MTRDEVRAAVAIELKEALRSTLFGALIAMRSRAEPDLTREAAALSHPMIAWMIEQGAWEAAMERRDEHSAEAWLASLADRLAFDFCLRHPDPHTRTLMVIREVLQLPKGAVMRDEHPVKQQIGAIATLSSDMGPDVVVGVNGVTRIEACEKSGEYAYIPYVRVWKGDVCAAEFCQHALRGVWFAPFPTERNQDEDMPF